MEKIENFFNRIKIYNKDQDSNTNDNNTHNYEFEKIDIIIEGNKNLFKTEKEQIIEGAKALLKTGKFKDAEEAIIFIGVTFRGLKFDMKK